MRSFQALLSLVSSQILLIGFEFDVCVTGASLIQQYQQPTRCNYNNFINNFNQLDMLRVIISLTLRSARLCLQLVV